jgi:hypothetical protein
LADIQQRFDILDDMANACAEGTVRALILSGPPGVGKSCKIPNDGKWSRVPHPVLVSTKNCISTLPRVL